MRFHSLDALRGMAAFAVVLFHLSPGWPGYLSVDLFFILSGLNLGIPFISPKKKMIDMKFKKKLKENKIKEKNSDTLTYHAIFVR